MGDKYQNVNQWVQNERNWKVANDDFLGNDFASLKA